ncbi:MAG: HAMP domain-containing protein, partial [Zetaproteobacteria bacterium]
MRGFEASILGSRPFGRSMSALARRTLPAYLPTTFPIAYKLALAFAIIVSLGMAILGWVIASDHSATLERQMIESSQTVAQQLAQVAKEPVLADDSLTLAVIVNHLKGQRGLLAVAIYSDELKPLAQAGVVPDPAIVADRAVTDGMFAYGRTVGDSGEPLVVLAAMRPMTVDGVTVGYVLIGFDRSIVEAAKQQTVRTVGFATLLFVLIGSLASIFLGKRLTRPIREIIRTSSAISAGNYDVRFNESRNDELGDLMKAMNAMTDGLAQKEHVEQTFSRYVAPQVAKEILRVTAQPVPAGRDVVASVLFA